MSVDFKKALESKFRNKILLWKSANDSAYSIESIRKSEIMQQVLKLKKIQEKKMNFSENIKDLGLLSELVY